MNTIAGEIGLANHHGTTKLYQENRYLGRRDASGERVCRELHFVSVAARQGTACRSYEPELALQSLSFR